jgi:hypothetical protein
MARTPPTDGAAGLALHRSRHAHPAASGPPAHHAEALERAGALLGERGLAERIMRHSVSGEVARRVHRDVLIVYPTR